jgi:hypothetical protein
MGGCFVTAWRSESSVVYLDVVNIVPVVDIVGRAVLGEGEIVRES